ncbi:[Pyruvate dehydrogenase [acetyl-transferring]]-phosphatase 1, mitochondrial [Coemansia sp. RSA 552]|nr:[Pyruvate dehydrogenase [acetyl-transferring]]-phosphatase 1, mitochondrial [Coemansia sp. RSA 552]
MAAGTLRKRKAASGSKVHVRSQSNSSNSNSSEGGQKTAAGDGKKNTALANTEGERPSGSGTKRSLTFAVGGVLTLLGVAGYTFFRQPTTEVADQQPVEGAVATALESVAAKRVEAKKTLDGLKSKERREKAKSLGMLSEEEVDAILHANENSWYLDPAKSRALGLRVDTNQVSSNDPIEDYLAWSPLGHTTTITPAGSNGSTVVSPQYMFSVFDGHAGFMCAEQLSMRLAPMLNESLGIIQTLKSDGGSEQGSGAKSKELVTTIKQLEKQSGIDWDKVPLALTATFVRMDNELVHGALDEFRRVQDMGRMDKLLGPAVSGSCGLVAVVDTDAREVVVGNTGDSRALLGVRLKDGRWKAVRLSEDQTAQNQKEYTRLAREHPDETVIQRGRVLGGLMPTRAFGDCRYKWPLEVQQDLFPVLYSRGHRYATTPRDYKTPPYVTAKPVIVRHQLSENDRFIVIASDGLYDQLSDGEVVDAVAQWYEANNEGRRGLGSLVTEDANAATHLIRAALSTDRLGRRSDSVIRRLLAIPPPHSRRFRDDISVTVVTLNQD